MLQVHTKANRSGTAKPITSSARVLLAVDDRADRHGGQNRLEHDPELVRDHVGMKQVPCPCCDGRTY